MVPNRQRGGGRCRPGRKRGMRRRNSYCRAFDQQPCALRPPGLYHSLHSSELFGTKRSGSCSVSRVRISATVRFGAVRFGGEPCLDLSNTSIEHGRPARNGLPPHVMAPMDRAALTQSPIIAKSLSKGCRVLLPSIASWARTNCSRPVQNLRRRVRRSGTPTPIEARRQYCRAN
jgi:hypothetical protein